MFKKARKRIVLSILAILSTVFLGTLGMVYLSSYLSVTAQNYQVLSEHIQKLNENPNGIQKDNLIHKGSDNLGVPFFNMREEGKMQRHLEINTFYSVKISEDGSAEVIENGAPDLYSDEELINLAAKASGKKQGKTGELLFMISEEQNATIVCFMDNMVFNENFMSLLLFTLLFGVIAMIIISFISTRIANRIVSPMEETYEKQKQFTADAGHELKSPVAAMAANIELLEREIGENKWLENIAFENTRMHDLVSELLELARNENKTVERKPTDLSHLVNSVVLPMEAAAFEKNIMIESDISNGISADIDDKGINQLVTILVDNAISHTQNTDGSIKTVSVVLSDINSVPVFSVTNPGEEIPESERSKLFERFYRSDSSHEFTGHYGLGLAIAKAIADANNAKISVSCQNDHVTFSVEFPAR